MGTRMLLSGKAEQLQAGTEAQAAQLSVNPRQKGRTRADSFHSSVPGNGLAPWQLFHSMDFCSLCFIWTMLSGTFGTLGGVLCRARG